MSTDAGPPEPASTRLEILIAVLLGIAATATAFASFQGAQKGGDSVRSYNEGISALSDANFYFTRDNSQYDVDLQLFRQYDIARAGGDTATARHIREQLMDGNLRAGVREFERSGDDGPPTPVDAEAYERPDGDQGAELQEKTDRLFAEARALDDTGDQYELVVVILALALFFFGLAAVLTRRLLRMSLLGIGTVILLVSLGMLAAV
jgi:hypothetical protein